MRVEFSERNAGRHIIQSPQRVSVVRMMEMVGGGISMVVAFHNQVSRFIARDDSK